jgi:NADPH:quinone reductase-like Zn-dependent oxidoreductase
MQAICYDRYGGPEVLRCITVPDPEPGPGEVRVRLFAAGLAPVDTKLRAGMLQAFLPLRLPKIPGRDGVGLVDRLGAGVTTAALGDRVCVLADQLGAGTSAEFLVCGVQRVVPRPPGLSTHQAAALLQPGLSAWIAVMETARIAPGMCVLVHGGSGAVGSLMVQLCRHLGAEVSATCRADNRDYVVGLGAARAIAYDREDFGTLRDQDVVFDLIGGETHARSYPVLRAGGHLVYLTAAPIVDRSADYGVRVTRAMITDQPAALQAVAQLAAQGVLRPAVARVFALADAALAHAELESGRATRGRVVLDIAPDTSGA